MIRRVRIPLPRSPLPTTLTAPLFPRSPSQHDCSLTVLPAEVGELGSSVSLPADERSTVLPTDDVSSEGSTLAFKEDCLISDHETSDTTVSSTIYEYSEHSELSGPPSTTDASPARIPSTKFSDRDLGIHSVEVSEPGDTPVLEKIGSVLLVLRLLLPSETCIQTKWLIFLHTNRLQINMTLRPIYQKLHYTRCPRQQQRGRSSLIQILSLKKLVITSKATKHRVIYSPQSTSQCRYS